MTRNLTQIGLGTARFTFHESVDLIKYALNEGVRVIDTSRSYGNGLTERLIGQAVKSHLQADTGLTRQDIRIISKFGHFAAYEKIWKSSIEVADQVFHSIDPDFMRNELTQSLQGLNTGYLDVFLIHNLEHQFHVKSGKDTELENFDASEERKQQFFENLEKIFEALEHEVSIGRIRSYGISSNTINHHNFNYFQPIDISMIAERVRTKLRIDRHHCTVLQVPGNLLESTAILKAKEQSQFEIMINRPLTAFIDDKVYKLVELPEYNPQKYLDAVQHALNYFNFQLPTNRAATEEELETFEGCQWLCDMIHQMNKSLLDFTSPQQYEEGLKTQLIPQFDEKFEGLDELSISIVENFFRQYGLIVRYHCGQVTKNKVMNGEYKLPTDKLLQHTALEWLFEQKGISTVLVGMSTTEQIKQNINIWQSTVERQK